MRTTRSTMRSGPETALKFYVQRAPASSDALLTSGMFTCMLRAAMVFVLLMTGRAVLADDVEAPRPPAFEEHWYVVTIQDQPCGYMNSIMRTKGDRVHTDTITEIEIKRDSATVKMRMEQYWVETTAGRPLSFRNVQTMGTVPQTIEGTIADGKVRLKTTQFAASHESEFDFDPACLFAWGQAVESMKRGLEPGTRYTLKTYEPSLRKDGAIEVGFVVHGREKVDVLGESRSLHHVTSSIALPAPGGAASVGGTIDSETWMDDEMTPVVMRVNLGFMKMKMYQTTKAEAMKRGAPPEMFLQTMIRADRNVPRGAKVTTYRLATTESDGVRAKLPTLPSTAMQTFERIDDYSGTVTVRRADWDELKSRPAGEVPEALDQYLQASSVCDSGDRKIRRLALRAAPRDDAPMVKARKLREFVTEYITAKGMDVGFATASEVAANRAGDCTEHSVLLAAMGRAAGVPARGVGGLVGIPGGVRDDANGRMEFGFHMWTQVYIHGQWVDIDAAMRQTECDTTHIAITLVPLGDEGMMGEVWSIVPLLGQLDIKVLDDSKAADGSQPSAVGRAAP